jgi:hypothetical protein
MTIDSNCKMHLFFFLAVLAPGRLDRRLHPDVCACTPSPLAHLQPAPPHCMWGVPARAPFTSHTHARGQQLQQVTTVGGYASIQKREGVADAKLAPRGRDIEMKVR